MGNMEKQVFLHLHLLFIGKDGIEDVLELQLTEDELSLFKNSCSVIREYAKKAETL